MSVWEIWYSIIPAGVGPDDYESHELEQRVELFEFDDPAPEMGFVYAKIEAALEPGAAACVLKMRTPDDAG
ncbi:hypothetical protein [Streptomyces bacillaris]|uniref:hypothetical protein n=1 Tax=Streptomyces bacillaris TaxID=68179 RepID=UPI0036344522